MGHSARDLRSDGLLKSVRYREGFTFCLETKSKQKIQGCISCKWPSPLRAPQSKLPLEVFLSVLDHSGRSPKLVYAVTQIFFKNLDSWASNMGSLLFIYPCFTI